MIVITFCTLPLFISVLSGLESWHVIVLGWLWDRVRMVQIKKKRSKQSRQEDDIPENLKTFIDSVTIKRELPQVNQPQRRSRKAKNVEEDKEDLSLKITKPVLSGVLWDGSDWLKYCRGRLWLTRRSWSSGAHSRLASLRENYPSRRSWRWWEKSSQGIEAAF